MESNQPINRDEILRIAELESELSDLKQHADKMLRGFENFNNFSSNRAIWELVQNACDLTDKCEIVIDYSMPGLSFTHNGKPFDTKALISLVKQVSGKYGEENDLPEVGKYGTGFLTTHTFGRKFTIDSILKANGVSFEIKDFLIDRSSREWKSLSRKIKDQKDNVYKLIREGVIVEDAAPKTTFTYIPETEQELAYTVESSRDLEDYLPIVLTINNRLKKAIIISKSGVQTSFERTDKQPVPNDHNINLFKTSISKNGLEKTVYSLVDPIGEIEIILPIDENLNLFEFSERVARLFLYYPLIGSEQFGLNFIINCNKFLPTEPRNGIHLKSNKDQLKNDEAENRRIIQKASSLIFSFLRSSTLQVNNPLLYAKVDFRRESDDNLLNTYFEELQAQWTEEIKTLPLVQTANGFKPANEVVFFSQELLNSEDAFDEIYQLTSLFYEDIPVKDKIVLWSKFALEWTNSGIRFINHEDLIRAISKLGLASFEKASLIKYYATLINEGRAQFFSDHSLLPNIEGKFFLLSPLLTPLNLPSSLIEIGKVLIPETTERLVHDEFRFNFHFAPLNRKDFSTSVKAKLDVMQVLDHICLPGTVDPTQYNTIDQTKVKLLNNTFFTNLLTYCKLNNNIHSQSKPSQLTRIISKYYSLNEGLIYLPSLETQDENLDIRSSRKILVQVFFNLLQFHNTQWVSNNLQLLFDIASCNEDSLKDVYATAKIYPNQRNVLRSINDLKRDVGVTEEIKNLYDKVSRDDIRCHLVYPRFNDFVAEDRYVTNKYLAVLIEEAFFHSDINNINEHAFKDEILHIISKLKEKHYSELFPRLDDRKANLMLEIVTNERTKDDIFSIVTLKEDQLKKLGQLVQQDNFEAILNKATAVLQLETEKQSDFRHKYEIGTNIERLIREKLSAELKDRVTFVNPETLQTSDVQGGQDIIIQVDGKAVYFIEVKSRWASESSVSMSKLQLERAVEQSHRYALCSVDISRYTGTNDRYNLSIEEVLPLTKFVRTIGTEIKPLIQENLTAEKNQASIHLVDYRGVIPQDIIQAGDEFQDFINSLSTFLIAIGSELYAQQN